MRAAVYPYLSVLPRVEQLYWGLRALGFFGLLFYLAVGGAPALWGLSAWGLVSIYAAVLGVPVLLVRWQRWHFVQVFWPLFLLDAVSIAVLIHATGGADSDFFVLYYALVPFAAYHVGLTLGLAAAGLVTAIYAAACVASAGLEGLSSFVFRAIMLWVLTTALGLVGRFVHLFAERLLNAMDKLNERTSELERTHAQLETIYETSRSLAELMSVDNVVDRVLSIASGVLNYPVCEIYIWDSVRQKLWLQGRVSGAESQRFEHPQQVEPIDVFRRVLRDGETVRIVDRHLGRAVVDGNPQRSQLAVPMVSEGKVVGLLNAESPRVNAFGERDQRVLSVLAASTAMALVNADLHQQMEKLIIIDELTGVFNYRYFRTRLEDEKRRAARYGQPLSLIMVDIDWFKGLNDRYGHQVGNVALRQLVRVIGACIRDVDILTRYGGEEFMIILPQTGVREAQAIGERIRHQVESSEFGPDTTGRPIHLTVSVGISCYPENGLPEDELVESVDQALYRAKGAGKNSISVSAG